MNQGAGATCRSTSGSVENHCTNWKSASLYSTKEMALFTDLRRAEGRGWARGQALGWAHGARKRGREKEGGKRGRGGADVLAVLSRVSLVVPGAE